MAFESKRLVLVALLGALAQGCSTTPRFNDHFGASVRSNLAAQVLDPAAATNGNPASGVDGAAAYAAHQRYQRSFKDAESASTPSLVGGSGAK